MLLTLLKLLETALKVTFEVVMPAKAEDTDDKFDDKLVRSLTTYCKHVEISETEVWLEPKEPTAAGFAPEYTTVIFCPV